MSHDHEHFHAHDFVWGNIAKACGLARLSKFVMKRYNEHRASAASALRVPHHFFHPRWQTETNLPDLPKNRYSQQVQAGVMAKHLLDCASMWQRKGATHVAFAASDNHQGIYKCNQPMVEKCLQQNDIQTKDMLDLRQHCAAVTSKLEALFEHLEITTKHHTVSDVYGSFADMHRDVIHGRMHMAKQALTRTPEPASFIEKGIDYFQHSVQKRWQNLGKTKKRVIQAVGIAAAGIGAFGLLQTTQFTAKPVEQRSVPVRALIVARDMAQPIDKVLAVAATSSTAASILRSRKTKGFAQNLGAADVGLDVGGLVLNLGGAALTGNLIEGARGVYSEMSHLAADFGLANALKMVTEKAISKGHGIISRKFNNCKKLHSAYATSLTSMVLVSGLLFSTNVHRAGAIVNVLVPKADVPTQVTQDTIKQKSQPIMQQSSQDRSCAVRRASIQTGDGIIVTALDGTKARDKNLESAIQTAGTLLGRDVGIVHPDEVVETSIKRVPVSSLAHTGPVIPKYEVTLNVRGQSQTAAFFSPSFSCGR